jgi:arylsulfatase A-like enzyme
LLFSTPQQRTARTATATATATAAATATATATTEHGAPAGGLASEGGSYAELVDLLPTLCELAGVPVPPTCADDAASASAAACTEGVSLAPLVRTEGTEGAAGVPKAAAFSQWQMNGHNAFSTWTRLSDGSPVRYTEWQNYDHSDKNGVFKAVWAVPPSFGAELYNHSADPDENHNIVATASQAVLDALRKTLHEGWRAQI